MEPCPGGCRKNGSLTRVLRQPPRGKRETGSPAPPAGASGSGATTVPAGMARSPSPSLRFDAVDLDRLTTPVLHQVDWEVGPAERWIVLGPNGSGKTTLFELASGY